MCAFSRCVNVLARGQSKKGQTWPTQNISTMAGDAKEKEDVLVLYVNGIKVHIFQTKKQNAIKLLKKPFRL